ncbi:MAG: hypothetical protein ACNA7V_05560 [Bacteroidales bacterium]
MKYFITKRFIIVSLAAFALTMMQSCYYDNEEELYPVAGNCDTTNVTYSGTVVPIMANTCNSCHGSSIAQGGIRTDNYTDLKTIADNDRLWGAINHETGYRPMPDNLPKMNDCNLAKIRKWLDDGALNN